MPFKTDLQLTYRAPGTMAADRQAVDLRIERGDLLLVSGRRNLVQAVINRLLTRPGELDTLGHPAYGCRIFLLIGEPNNQRTRARAELYIREALAMETRIKEVIKVAFEPPSLRFDKRDALEITVTILPQDDAELLVIPLAVNLSK